MRRTVTAFAALGILFALLTISRTLRGINYQLTMMSCLYQADHAMLCREARRTNTETPKETAPHV
jgi:hypothetical protein